MLKGPDEYHGDVTDSVYCNVVAAMSLRAAHDLAPMVDKTPNSTYVSPLYAPGTHAHDHDKYSRTQRDVIYHTYPDIIFFLQHRLFLKWRSYEY